ncbi:MAG: apolipoprotein N-acyltransferase, partial [Burkholderiaceae bacterium]|nr:apolipoprotein N-acyltransferase [Burkholderiaceae bacterium]
MEATRSWWHVRDRSGPFGVLALVAAGLVQALSLALPGSGEPSWWLQTGAMAMLAWRLDARTRQGASWREGALLVWVFAFAWLCGTFWWLFVSLHVYGGLSALLAVVSVGALAALLALYYAAAGAIYVALFGRGGAGHPVWRALVFAALWTLAELMRAEWFTGFPWGAVGYGQGAGPMAPMVKLVGVYGLGAAAAIVSFVLMNLLCRPWSRASRQALWMLVPLALLSVGGHHGYSRDAGMLSVTLLQGNIAQDEKFQAGTGVADALRWYGEQLRDARTQLVVAPETALPVLPQQLPVGYGQALRDRFARGEQAALIGVPLGSLAQGYTNSVLGLKPGAVSAYTYDKHHLVPFGEFIP